VELAYLYLYLWIFIFVKRAKKGCQLQLKCLAILPCDLSVITIHISDCRQFTDIHISQGSVATYLRCVGIFKDGLVANLPLGLPTKEFWKWVNIWGSCGQEHSVLCFCLSVVAVTEIPWQSFVSASNSGVVTEISNKINKSCIHRAVMLWSSRSPCLSLLSFLFETSLKLYSETSLRRN